MLSVLWDTQIKTKCLALSQAVTAKDGTFPSAWVRIPRLTMPFTAGTLSAIWFSMWHTMHVLPEGYFTSFTASFEIIIGAAWSSGTWAGAAATRCPKGEWCSRSSAREKWNQGKAGTCHMWASQWLAHWNSSGFSPQLMEKGRKLHNRSVAQNQKMSKLYASAEHA